MAYRILFTGAFETGKTTLFENFCKYPFVEGITEVARELLNINPSLETDPSFPDKLFAEQIYRETKAHLAGKAITICDRGIVDIIAYAEVLGYPTRQEWSEKLIGRYDLVAIFSMADIPAPTRYYSINLPVQEFRQRIDTHIRDTVKRYHFPSIEIAGSIEKRESALQSFLVQNKVWPDVE